MSRDMWRVREAVGRYEAKRIGELMFLFKDTHGLPERLVKEIVEEVVKTKEYQDHYDELLGAFVNHLDAIGEA